MFSFATDSVHQAMQYSIEYLLHSGVEESSRNGPVLVSPGPVCIEYIHPRNRVLLSATRDANHVFHLMEALWMLSGSNDIEFPTFFNSTYGQFSDDGKTMWDAYGWRWREFFGYDQLEGIVDELHNNKASRRCVLTMWNGAEWTAGDGPDPSWQSNDSISWWQSDLFVALNGGKAVPCNTHAYFAIRDGRLNMTVMNRSNDLVWGALGANVVHFSFLLEYMAMRIGVPMGSYYQFTNNLHIYTDKFSREKLDAVAYECVTLNEEVSGPALEPGFDEDLKLFMSWALLLIRVKHTPPATWKAGTTPPAATTLACNIPDLKTTFMTSVVIPMFLFWLYRKWKDEYSSDICLNGIDAPDWRRACSEWSERRAK